MESKTSWCCDIGERGQLVTSACAFFSNWYQSSAILYISRQNYRNNFVIPEPPGSTVTPTSEPPIHPASKVPLLTSPYWKLMNSRTRHGAFPPCVTAMDEVLHEWPGLPTNDCFDGMAINAPT
ncbi:hypothetical protein PoB_003422400 [Plakobranchus ocellatus]|uniref:Uncharacterized protein n=1 Tax=Plakobranchus ocellatus TaxID=259542 RepID=A0AAV4AMY0_9GAST|nr:hypothetical protein PoB_003422400 [Plakobranchus ocellatus]